MRKSTFLKKQISLLEPTKSRKIIAVDFIRKKEKSFSMGLSPSFSTDNKLFWKIVNPFFSDKGNYGANIKLVEEQEVLQNDSQITEKLNEFFKNSIPL